LKKRKGEIRTIAFTFLDNLYNSTIRNLGIPEAVEAVERKAAVKLLTPQRLNIRTRMLILCFGVAAPLLAIGSFALWKEYRTLRTEASRATEFQAAIVSRTLRQWMLTQLSTLSALGALPDVQHLQVAGSKKIFSTALRAENTWEDLTLLDTSGHVVVALTNKPTITTTEVFDFSVLHEKLLYEKVLKTQKGLISGYSRSPISSRPALLALSPVFLEGKIQGVMVTSVEPKSVLRLFQGLGESEGSMVAVVDDTNRVVARTLQSDYWQGKDFSQARTVKASSKVRKGHLEIVGIADPIARAYAFERLPENNWHVEVGVPLDTIYGSAHDWLVIMVVLAGCALGISTVLAFSATNHFTKNISILVRETLAIGRGDLSKRVVIPARDELGLLARAFNLMAEQLQLNQEFKVMVDGVSESIRHSLDLNEILHTSVRELGQALNASRCCLAIMDDHDTLNQSDDELHFDYEWWNPERSGEPLHNRVIKVTEESVLKMILAQGSILSLDVINNAGWHPIFERSDESPDDWKSIQSLIACPINTKDGAIGIILVHQCDERRVWTDSELDLVDAVTKQIALAMQHAHLYSRTKTMAEQEMLINQIVSATRSSLDLDQILTTVSLELSKALGADRCQIAQPRSEGPLVVTYEFHKPELTSAKGLNLYPDQIDFNPNRPPTNPNINIRPCTLLGINLEQLLTDDAGALQKPSYPDLSTTQGESPLAVINDVEKDSRSIPFNDFLDKVNSRALIAAPLLNDKRLIGLLVVHQCTQPKHWRAEEIRLVAAVADQLAIAISHAQLFAQVRYQAITDGLTGLYNHIYFKNRLQEELRTAQRKGLPCSLLMIDLDKLKQINDNFGHPVGDAAISQIANILKKILRSGDTAARYGGEEFGIILPGSTLIEAALIADRLCAQIRNTPVPGLGRITASIGAATYPMHASTSAELVENADKALYVAKNSGRDQARIYQAEPIALSSTAVPAPGPSLQPANREPEQALQK
jgi:diguanylate cyclase (GGDEF)-like protein